LRTFPDVRMRALVVEAHRAQQLLDQSNYSEARKAFVSVSAKARQLGLASAYLAWGAAVCTDLMGEPELAFTTIQEAIALDPFNPSAQQSFESIAWRLRNALADPARAPEDPSTPRIYRLLLEAGEADVHSHVAMARHHAHAGRNDRALALLDAVTLLSPVSRDAWVLKAAVARAMANEALAAECEAQAAALANTSVPFGIPGAAAPAC
jgi:tetratricopeptide (TPR) repeat protein